jgi:hypothetical protein
MTELRNIQRELERFRFRLIAAAASCCWASGC